ncbi:MAG TPA: hypothetical protein VGI39_28035, partial [Polyangiaceae bacterium]
PEITWIDRNGKTVPGLTVPTDGVDLARVLYFDAQGDTWIVNTVTGSVAASAGEQIEWWASKDCSGTGLVSLVVYVPGSTVELVTATDTEYRVVPDSAPPATTPIQVASSGTGLTCNSASSTTIDAVLTTTAYPTTTTLPDLSAYAFPVHPVYGG